MAFLGAWHTDRLNSLETNKQKNLLPEINYKQEKHNRINIEAVDYIISFNQRKCYKFANPVRYCATGC